jgi:hypothetical protein
VETLIIAWEAMPFYFDPMVCVLPLAIEAKMPKKHKTAMMINAIRMLFKKSG